MSKRFWNVQIEMYEDGRVLAAVLRSRTAAKTPSDGYVQHTGIEGFKTELDVTSANGKNPYRLAQEELADMAATEDSRRAMIEKLRTYLTKKGVSV
jgi:hypothetical protein